MFDFEIKYRKLGKNAKRGDQVKTVKTCEDGRFTVKIIPETDIVLSEFTQKISFPCQKGDKYFFNGYQSWTDTKEFTYGEKQRDANRIPKFLNKMFSFDRYGDATFFKPKKNALHGYDLFYCRGLTQTFAFNFNYKNAYLTFELDEKAGELTLKSDFGSIILRTGEEYTVADYYYVSDLKKGFSEYRKFFPERPIQKIFGYTSWYNYYQDINEKILLRDLDGLDERFNLFQIDDGYEQFVGDWLKVDKIKFPGGLSPVVKKIHDKGLMAGIWLAPFVAEEKSDLFRHHKNYFKKVNGEYVKCGSNWSGFYALDMENPKALSYIEKCLKHYVDMGFDFFKLDFLYAANLPEYDGKSRSQVAEKAYAFLRECLGDKLILGCGATPVNCIDKFDYLRIGPDVSLKFDDVFYMRRMHRERVSAKVTIQNTVYRRFMNARWFGNDPDVFLLRDDNIKLSKKQKLSLITLNALFGSVMMTSDDVGKYDDEKKKILADSLDLFYNAKVLETNRIGKVIRVIYELNGEKRSIDYHTQKGEIL
ncbi:MAG: alpha-galactosidase [Clostridia bacterium]|nr:alpha-galactosidase [Clostridia bacterium]